MFHLFFFSFFNILDEYCVVIREKLNFVSSNVFENIKLLFVKKCPIFIHVNILENYCIVEPKYAQILSII